MKPFYKRLSYSLGNEDPITEQMALNIQPQDTVLSIIASGDRPLNLLVKPVKKIIAIDANPVQKALLELKIHSLKKLDYETYIAFLGLRPCQNRLEIFEELKGHLGFVSNAFFSKNLRKIEKGIIFQGAMERIVNTISKFVRFFRGKKVEKLFSFNDLEKQREFVQKEWDTLLWRSLFKLAMPFVRGKLKDPGLYQHISPNIDIGDYLYQRIHNSFINFLAKENPIFSLTFAGKIFEESYPPYLQAQSCEFIRERLDCIEAKTIDLLSYLNRAQESSIDCYSLSDVASYLSRESFEKVLQKMVFTARPGARFCIRQFLSNHTIPEYLQAHFQRNLQLEHQLEGRDRCIFYRFMVGEIKK